MDDVVSHQDIISTSTFFPCPIEQSPTLDRTPVEKFIEMSRLPHLLFYGPPGTGKTSTILAVARRIYGPNYKKQILEVWPLSSRL
jgi:replication factor C subunit 3/5